MPRSPSAGTTPRRPAIQIAIEALTDWKRFPSPYAPRSRGRKSLTRYRLAMEHARDAIVKVYNASVSRAELEEEMERLLKENRELCRAVVKYVELEDEYNRAREEGQR